MCVCLSAQIHSMSISLAGIRYNWIISMKSQHFIYHLLTLKFDLFNKELDPALSGLTQKQEIK